MNTYYSYYDAEENITTFYELDEELYCLRTTFKTLTDVFNSNSPLTPSHLFLPEGSFSDCIEKFIQITKEEFLNIWKQANNKYLSLWEKLKNSYQINQKIETTIVYFPQQEVIVQFGENFYGLANYNDCLSILNADRMYPNNLISLYIESFDDDNLWVNFSTTPSK